MQVNGDDESLFAMGQSVILHIATGSGRAWRSGVDGSVGSDVLQLFRVRYGQRVSRDGSELIVTAAKER